MNHERPPILTYSILEVKMLLTDIAKECGISGDLEIDNGQMLIYRIQVHFPAHFSHQALLLQFDYYDTSRDNDYSTIDRIAKNLDA